MKNNALHWLQNQKKIALFGFIVVLLSIAIGCQHEQSKVETVLDEPSNTEGVFKIAYDMETMSYTNLENANLKPTPFEDIGMMPKVKKSAIKMVVFEDGTSDWTIKDVEPNNKIVYADKTPPNKHPKTVLTRIDRSGLARFFDKDDNEKYQYKMPTQSMKDFVSILRGDTSDAGKSLVGNSILTSRAGINIRQALENAVRNGATIKSISKNVVIITSSNGLPNGQVQTRTEQKIVESVIDTSQRILLGSTVKKEQGVVFARVYMKYNYSTANPTLEMMEQRAYDPDSPADRRTVHITSTSFSNIQFNVH
jgi:hypothetical protein